jgi:hypothetical protein
MNIAREKISDRTVLLVIAGGMIAILLAIIIGIFLCSRPGFTLPNWAENVFVSIATAAVLKLGDCLSTLVALSQGKHISQMGTQLAETAPSAPKPPPPADAGEAARQTADAADDRASEIEEAVEEPKP